MASGTLGFMAHLTPVAMVSAQGLGGPGGCCELGTEEPPKRHKSAQVPTTVLHSVPTGLESTRTCHFPATLSLSQLVNHLFKD